MEIFGGNETMKYRVDPEYMSNYYYNYCKSCDYWGSSGCLATDAVQEEECPIRERMRR